MSCLGRAILQNATAPRLNVFLTVLLFAAGVVLLAGAVITGANYFQTRQAASRVAAATMDTVVERINGEVSTFFGAANLLIDIYATTPRVTDGGHDVDRLLTSLFRALDGTPHIAGLYAGYENGDFWEVFSFSAADKALVAQVGGPEGSRYALHGIFADEAGLRRETWRFFDAAGRESAGPSGTAPAYDPRTRIWYKEARARHGEFIRTPPYIFSVAQRPGLTLGKSFDGATAGVVAVDVTLDRLSQFLGTIRPSERHRIMMFDPDGSLLASSNPEMDASSPTARITDFKDSSIQAAAALFAAQGPFPIAPVSVDGEQYLASVVRLPQPELNTQGDLILNVAPRSDFEGTLAGAATRSLISGLIVILLALPAIIYLAKLVSRPINELATNAKLIEAILETVPSPVFCKDSEARYISCNGAFETAFGTTRADVIGKQLTDLVHLPEEDRRTHQADQQQIMRNGVTVRRELTLPLAGGPPRETLYHATGFHNADGTPGGLVGTLVDITELKETQHALAEAKEVAEAATKAKGEFLASMSHEIRTPLNGITGMADLLAQTALDDDQRHMLATVRESGNALMRVINDILDFSKIEAGKLAIEEIPMSVADALEGVAITLTPGARAKDVAIHAFVDPAIPATVMGDPVRLRQILFNLAGNAVKFSNKRDVELRALAAANGRVRFEVIDHGIGISPENQGKLFQAFSQAEASTTRRFGGTGLGLAICKRLTDLMGGVIGVTSELGRGSTFFAELPFGAAEAPAREAARDLGGLRVLLAGCPEPREAAIRAYLAHWGAAPMAAGDEGEALARCAAAQRDGAPFDSVIIDLDLDTDRQAAFLAAVRAACDTARTRVIMLQDSGARGPRIKDADLVTVDANPLVRYRIVTAVAVAAGRASPEVRVEEEEAAAPVRAPTVAEAAAAGQLILLTEDNPTNQDVIRRQLQRLGYACEIAGNGAEALKAWRTGRYALILTDCHMPEMDGYEMTGHVRAAERALGPAAGGRIPIVAITANALQGEAERCLAAGMDDYLSKPIGMKALRDTLRKWMPQAAAAAPAAAPDVPARDAKPHTGGAVDPGAIKAMFGDDETTFREILNEFVAPSEDIIRAAAAAHAARDAGGVKDAAHQLKSAARTIGANALADTCVELEAAGKAANWDAITRLVVQSERQMADVLNYIRAL